jgi:hypothetical protein
MEAGLGKFWATRWCGPLGGGLRYNINSLSLQVGACSKDPAHFDGVSRGVYKPYVSSGLRADLCHCDMNDLAYHHRYTDV